MEVLVGQLAVAVSLLTEPVALLYVDELLLDLPAPAEVAPVVITLEQRPDAVRHDAVDSTFP